MVGAERMGAVAQEVVWTAGEGGWVRGTPEWVTPEEEGIWG